MSSGALSSSDAPGCDSAAAVTPGVKAQTSAASSARSVSGHQGRPPRCRPMPTSRYSLPESATRDQTSDATAASQDSVVDVATIMLDTNMWSYLAGETSASQLND